MRPFGWKIALYFTLVFVAGAGVGALGTYQYTSTHQHPHGGGPSGAESARKQAIDELTKRLKLTPEQVSKLDPIFDQTRKEFGEFRERHRDETKAIYERQTARIEAMLTPEQVPEFRKLHEERQREREKAEREKAAREKAEHDKAGKK